MWPHTPAPPPAPGNAATIQKDVRETAAAIRGQAIEERDRLTSGMANTVGELVRNVQDAHRQGMSELLNNLNRGFAPTITNLFQSDNRRVTLADQGQVARSKTGQFARPETQPKLIINRSQPTNGNPGTCRRRSRALKTENEYEKGAQIGSRPCPGQTCCEFDRWFQGGSECTQGTTARRSTFGNRRSGGNKGPIVEPCPE